MEQKDKTEAAKIITRYTACENFTPRKSIFSIDGICWFCRYAAFDMSADELPESGSCRYPDVQII